MGMFDWIRDKVESVTNWMADQVQTTTGEKERRESVSRLKDLAIEFKNKVSEAILILNKVIERFNEAIRRLNHIRNTKVAENIEILHTSLGKFGNCKPVGAYVSESEKMPEKFPDREFEKIENYISGVDWSSDEVFFDTFILSPIGMKMKTRKQNLSMRERIGDLQLLMEKTLNELQERTNWTEKEIDICSLYVSNIEFIQNVISQRIIPELELVEAFMESQKIKNELIAGNAIEKLDFNYSVECLKNTDYHKHYQFIKNAVAFYIISCKIYNTPVLTNLLNHQTTEKDSELLKEEHKLLEYQAGEVDSNMSVQRKENGNGNNGNY